MTGTGRLGLGAAAMLALGGCLDMGTGGGSGATPPPELGVFGPGYPNPGDACRRAGETAFTNQFLDDGSDLVACPPGSDPGLFAATFGARQMTQMDGWTVFSVPRR